MVNTETVIFAFFYELIIGALCTSVSFFMFKRYLANKLRATIYISFAPLLIGFAVLNCSFGRLTALFTGIDMYYHGFQFEPFVWIALSLVINNVAIYTYIYYRLLILCRTIE